MSKSLSLFFAFTSVLLMTATAIFMSYNGWIALLFGLLTIVNMGLGFAVKAKRSRRTPKGS